MLDKRAFLDRLQAQLTGLTSEERAEAMEYYEEYFADAGEENEEDVLLSLGSPEDVAEQIKAGLHKADEGMFTESGYREKTEADNPPDVYGRKRDDAEAESREAQSGTGHAGARSADSHVGAGGGQNGNDYGGCNGSRSQNGYAYQNGGQDRNGYGNRDGEPYRGGFAGQNSGQKGGRYRGGYAGKKKSELSGGMIVLLVVLAIFASPIIIALGAAFVGVIVGILGAVFGVVAAIIAVVVALFAAGVVLFIVGFSILFHNPFAGIVCIALGCFMIALFLLLTIALVAVFGKFFPWLIREVESFGKYLSRKWSERKRRGAERA